MRKELQASDCKRCKGKKTVEWFEEEFVFMCSACGWIDKQKGNDEREKKAKKRSVIR